MAKNKKIGFFLIFTFFVCLINYFLIYKLKFSERPVRSDAAGYYAYLPAFLIYQDFSLANVDLYQPDAQFFVYPPIYYNQKTGRYIDKYPIGTSLLLLPFFLLAHLVSFVLRFPLTGYTLLYQHFAGIAGIFYLVAGLFFLSKSLKNFFSSKIILLTLLSLVFGTNLFHYACFDSLMSHVFSFFLLSLFLYQLQLWSKKTNRVNSCMLGLIIGLIFLVRNLNVIFSLLLIPFLKKKFKFLSLIMLSFFIVLLPQLFYWYYAGGNFLLFSYQGEGFNFFQPNFYGVLLSPRKGLFFWSPLFLLTFFGVKDLRDKIKQNLWLMVIAMALFAYFISSWHDWAFGAGFGHRAFIDIYPILSFFLAASLERLTKKIGTKKTIGILLIFILLNLTNMYKYWRKILPNDQITLEIYLKNFFVFRK